MYICFNCIQSEVKFINSLLVMIYVVAKFGTFHYDLQSYIIHFTNLFTTNTIVKTNTKRQGICGISFLFVPTKTTLNRWERVKIFSSAIFKQFYI